MNWSPGILGARIGAEVHDQRPHRRVGFAGGLPRQRVDVRQHAVAQAIEIHQNRLRVGPIRPQFVFVRMTRAVNPQDGIERAVLKPANKKFAEGRIGGIAEDKSANVRGPIRNSRKREIQACWNLSLEAQPIRVDVARPSRNCISLRARERRTRQDEDALLVRSASLSLINRLGVEQRISVDIAVSAAGREFVIQQDVLFLPFGFRFGRIHPPGIERRC